MSRVKRYIKLNKIDFILAARYLVSFIILIMILQKLFNPAESDNFSEFIAFLIDLDSSVSTSVLNPLFYGIIIIEAGIVMGLYKANFFNSSIYAAIIILCFEIIASSYSAILGLKSTCSYGLFGENPYLLLAQQSILLTLFLTVGFLKSYYFPK